MVALLFWATGSAVAIALPILVDVNPFLLRDGTLPLAVGGLCLLALCGVAWRRGATEVSGAAAGLLAAYTVLVLTTSLHGTPFGFEGVYGDTGRLSALVVRYSVSWAGSDGIVAGVPSDYPPLFAYLTGKAAMLLDVPAWRMLKPAEIFTISASIVAGFALWSRITVPPAALAISALGLIAFGIANKPYEAIALAVFVPWVLLTVARPERGRLRWPLAGTIGGLLVLTYYPYVLFASLGIAALVWLHWRTEEDPRAYLRYLAKITGIIALLSAWFFVPYLAAMLTGGQLVSDMFQAAEITWNPFPFLEMSPLGLTQLAGLAGLLRYRRTAWWATPLLALVAGAYAYYAIGLLRWVATAHTGLLHYTMPLIKVCLVAAAVLTVARAAPAVQRWPALAFPPGTAAVAIGVVLAYTGFTYWTSWMPANQWNGTDDGGVAVNQSATNWFPMHAHAQAYPDGRRPRFVSFAEVSGHWGWFPVTPIADEVAKVRPRDRRPRTLSYDEQLFAFLPWKGYLGVDRNASAGPSRWPDRHAELDRIAQISDPAEFARESANTRFGPIDVFVLRKGDRYLEWKGLRVPNTIRFERAQFDPSVFEVLDLPESTTIAIRRP